MRFLPIVLLLLGGCAAAPTPEEEKRAETLYSEMLECLTDSKEAKALEIGRTLMNRYSHTEYMRHVPENVFGTSRNDRVEEFVKYLDDKKK